MTHVSIEPNQRRKQMNEYLIFKFLMSPFCFQFGVKKRVRRQSIMILYRDKLHKDKLNNEK